MTDHRNLPNIPIPAGVQTATRDRINMLLTGPAGSRATMIARRISGLMPDPTEHQARWIAAEYDARSQSRPGFATRPLSYVRPFRAPHSSISSLALTGDWGDWRRGYAGEVELARFGVLYLDDLPEFSRTAIRGLSQRLLTMAGPPLVVASAMLCPCGSDWVTRRCICSASAITEYSDRVDDFCKRLRIDMEIDLTNDVRAANRLNQLKATI